MRQLILSYAITKGPSGHLFGSKVSRRGLESPFLAAAD